MKQLTTLYDVNSDDLNQILNRATELKTLYLQGDRPQLLTGHVLVQLFEKPSLRTRNSFEAAMVHLGGSGIFMTTAEAGLNGRESVSDVARVLSSFSDVITMRTFSQDLIDQFAADATCPVINGLSDASHPCQALTDLLTIQEEFESLAGRHLVFVGDGNNVATSLAIGTAITGMRMTIAAPGEFQLSEEFMDTLSDRYPRHQVTQCDDPHAAVESADIVYTDVWASMGQEAEAEKRLQAFASFQVNARLMASAPTGARFMHDLPAKRGLEVTDDVIDGNQSIVFRQAENRMHLARGLFAWILDR
jgi:ornithine carbamoyltransferase